MTELNLFTPHTHFIGLELAAKLTISTFAPSVQLTSVKDVSDLFFSAVNDACQTTKKSIECYLTWGSFKPPVQNITVYMAGMPASPLSEDDFEVINENDARSTPEPIDPYAEVIDAILGPNRAREITLPPLIDEESAGPSLAGSQADSLHYWLYSLITQRDSSGNLELNEEAVNRARGRIERVGYNNYLYTQSREYVECVRHREGALSFALNLVNRVWEQRAPAASSALAAGVFTTLTMGPTGAIAAGLMAGAGKVFDNTLGGVLWEKTLLTLRGVLSTVLQSSVQSVEHSTAGKIWNEFIKEATTVEDRVERFKKFVMSLRGSFPHEGQITIDEKVIEPSDHLALEMFVVEVINVVSNEPKLRGIVIELLKLMTTKNAIIEGETIINPIGVARIIGYIKPQSYSIKEYSMLIYLLKNVDGDFKDAVVSYLSSPPKTATNESGHSINPIDRVLSAVWAAAGLSNADIAQLSLILPLLTTTDRDRLKESADVKRYLKNFFSELFDRHSRNFNKDRETYTQELLFSFLAGIKELDEGLFKEGVERWLGFIIIKSKDMEYKKSVIEEFLCFPIDGLEKVMFDYLKSNYQFTFGEMEELNEEFVVALMNLINQ